MAFLDFLGALTGVEGLIADPHFRGAGLSLTLPGGHLALHADFNRDRTRHLERKLTVLYYLVPELEGAAPFGLPVLAEVIEDRDLALEVPRSIAVEVRVQREVPARKRERQPRAPKVRIGDEPLDARERAEEIEERHARELGEQVSQGRVDALEAGALELPEPRRLLAIVAPHPAVVIWTGEARSEFERELCAEEPVEEGVRIRTRGAVLVALREGEIAKPLSIEEESGSAERRRADDAHQSPSAKYSATSLRRSM